MIPSFYPIHDKRRHKLNNSAAFSDPGNATFPGGLGDALGGQDPATGLKEFTIDELVDASGDVSYPDDPEVFWRHLVRREGPDQDGGSPFTETGAKSFANVSKLRKVAVIGGGISGLMTTYQLLRAGFHVSLFHYDYIQPGGTGRLGAGRINPIQLLNTYDVGRASGRPAGQIVSSYLADVQLGAMRFPTSSNLFWWYWSLLVQTPSTSVIYDAFPNPGKVPSIVSMEGPGTGPENLVYGFWNKFNGGKAPGAGAPAGYPSNYPNYQALLVAHFNAFNTYIPPGETWTADRIATILKVSNRTTAENNGIKKWWLAAAKELYRVKYYNFLLKAKTNHRTAKDFTADEVSKIGALGFGTGGFGPLFGISALDIMRLVLWDYADEVEVNPFLLVLALRSRINAPGNNSNYDEYNRVVNAIRYVPGSDVYQIATTRPSTGSTSVYSGFDHVVVAMSHKAADQMLGQGKRRWRRAVGAADEDNTIYPYDVSDTKLTGSATNFARDLGDQAAMDSIKIFHDTLPPQTYTNGTPVYDNLIVNANVRFQREIRCAYGRSDPGSANQPPLGTTYHLAVKTDVSRIDQLPAGSGRNIANWRMGLHYAWQQLGGNTGWNNEVSLLIPWLDANISRYNGVTIQVAGDAFGGFENKLIDAIGARYGQPSGESRFTDNHYGLAYFSGTTPAANARLSASKFYNNMSNPTNRSYAIVRWSQVPLQLMGFKLDAPGYGAYMAHHAQIIARVSVGSEDTLGTWIKRTGDWTYSCRPSVKKVYFTGCSFSHYGGWIEGALMSSLRAVAAITNETDRVNPGTIKNGEITQALLYTGTDPGLY